MNEENKIIPINRAFVRSLEQIIKDFGERCGGPKTFNAIFIDRKGFIKQGQVDERRPSVRFAVPPKFKIGADFAVSDRPPVSLELEYVDFYYYRTLGNILEYRE